MASLRDIRTRIASTQNTQQVTRAMKMVSAAKLRRAQERIFATRPFAYKLRDVILDLQGLVDPSEHPLFEQRPVRRALVIVVTGDRGLAGPFNTNAIKTAEQAIRERYEAIGRENVTMIAVGRKGHEYFAKRGFALESDFRGAFDRLNVRTADAVGDLAVAGFKEGRWDEVVLVYNEFKNTISQNRIVEPILPIPTERFLTPVMESAEAKAPAPKARKAAQPDYIFEPGPKAILEALVPQFLTYQIWRALLESNAAEQGARMVAMDNATTNADELLKTLKLQYNQARQASITNELIEIVSGANALAG